MSQWQPQGNLSTTRSVPRTAVKKPDFITLPTNPSQPTHQQHALSMDMMTNPSGAYWSSDDLQKPSQSASFASSHNSVQFYGPGAQGGQLQAVQNVEMPSIYSETPIDDTHTKWVAYFRLRLEEMRRNLEQWDQSIRTFEGSQFAGNPNSKEYHGELQEVMKVLLGVQCQNGNITAEMETYITSLKPIEPTGPLCSQCQLANTPSSLSCPSRHTLCIECAAVKYINKDLKCMCECPWSQEQCRTLHEALQRLKPELNSALPATPHLPLGDVECQNCHRVVGNAAIDPYICTQSHNICKMCARKCGQFCPECSRLAQ